MRVPEWLLIETDYNIAAAVQEYLEQLDKTDFTMEISLGKIVSVSAEDRVFLDMVQLVLLKELPCGFRYEAGIRKIGYNAALDYFRDDTVVKSRDTLSFCDTVRKKCTVGAPKYERKYREDVCFIHMPYSACDIRVSLCRTVPVENPDRRPASYTYVKSRERLERPEGKGTVILEKTSELGRTVNKDDSYNRSKYMDITYDIRLRLDTFDGLDYPSLIEGLTGCGFYKP